MHLRDISKLTRGITAAAMACALVVPSVASAATIHADVWQDGKISITDINAGASGATPTYIVTLRLPSTTKLPTKIAVAIPIPDGASPIWAGEMSGISSSADITAPDAREVKSGGHSYITFKLTKYRTAQVECDPPPGTVTGNNIRLAWAPTAKLGPVYFSILAPSGDGVVSSSKITAVAPTADGTFFTTKYASLKAGQEGVFEGTLVASATPGGVAPAQQTTATAPNASPAAPAAAAPGLSSGAAAKTTAPATPSGAMSPTTALLLVAVLLIAIAGVLAWVLAKTMRARPQPGDDADSETDEDE